MAKTPKQDAPAPQDEAARLKAAEEAEKLKTSKSARKKAEEDDDDDDEDEDDEDDEDDDEEISPHVVSATETRNALKIMGQFLAPFFPAHKKGISLILIAVVIETIYNTSFPLLLKFPDRRRHQCRRSAHADHHPRTMFALGVVSSIVMVWFEWLNADTGSAMIRDIRNRLFDHSQALPVDYYHKNKTAWCCSASRATSRSSRKRSTTACNGACCRCFELIAATP